MSFIQMIGLPASDPVPGTYVQINFGSGEASSGSTTYNAILIGNRLSTGTAQDDGYIYGPDTNIPLATESDAISLFGVGSELHRMWRAFTAVNLTTSVYAIVVKESTGAAATGTITFATTATSAGTCRIFLNSKDYVDVGIATGDTPTVIGDSAVTAINGQLNWPFTAANSSGTVTLTSKQKGLRGNFIRYSAQITPSSGIGTTVTPLGRTNFTGGTVSDNNTNALATLSTQRFYYQVSAAEDAANLGRLAAQIDANALPAVGSRCRGVFASVDTLANATTVATGINDARLECTWLNLSDVVPAELAANAAAVYSLQETAIDSVRGMNLDYYGTKSGDLWLIPAPMQGNGPTRSQIKSAILSGLSPIQVIRPGVSTLVTRVTTRTLQGLLNDFRTRDGHIVTVCDFYGDDLRGIIALNFAGRTIGNDPGIGQTTTPAMVTPSLFKVTVNALTESYTNLGRLDNPLVNGVPTIQSQTVVVRESNPSTALSVVVPLKVISVAHRFNNLINQV